MTTLELGEMKYIASGNTAIKLQKIQTHAALNPISSTHKH